MHVASVHSQKPPFLSLPFSFFIYFFLFFSLSFGGSERDDIKR